MSRATATVAVAAALALAVVAVVGGSYSDDSGTGSSVSTSAGSDGGGQTTARTTPPSLQSAFDAARYYLDNEEGLSKSAVLQRMSANGGESYSEAEATYAVNHVGADWKAQALEDAKNRLESQGLSKKGLMAYLTAADGFSKAEATYAVSRAGRDWNAEAVRAAKSALEERQEATSKSQLIKYLKISGFTTAQVRYAVEEVY